jgi:hypothetical protein
MKNIILIFTVLFSTLLYSQEVEIDSKSTCVAVKPMSFAKQTGVLFAWADSSNFWTRDSDGIARISISFLDGSSYQKAETLKRIQYIDSICSGIIISQESVGIIRISFKGVGHWSYVGKNCLRIREKYPTTNIQLGRFDTKSEYDRVVYHEFFHALGFEHEHQHQDANIPWNKAAVYRYYKATQGWSKSQIDFQVLDRKLVPNLFTNGVDKYSIMMYPVPRELTFGGYEIGWNKKLTKMDIELLNKAYPKP